MLGLCRLVIQDGYSVSELAWFGLRNALDWPRNPNAGIPMAIDLKTLSPKELQALIANASAQMHEAHAAQIQAVKQKIETLLSNSGFSLEDIYPSRGKKASAKKGKTGSVAPKYQDPSDPSLTWSGRGRKPAWFAKALRRRGVTEETLLIGGSAKAAAPAKQAKAAKKAPRKVAKRVSKKAKKSA
ncbi:H-NS family nucleoid-associated regulatory protein [Dyella sp. 20L07]|uniref:H-NS histone family protein n=1 Tax=Dyella sp. 20L07 TaxID=3384240 RepID=UPI003D26C0DD